MKTSCFTRFTGATAIAAATAKLTEINRPFVLRSVRIHVGVAPTTAENLVIALTAKAGAAYNMTIHTIAMSGVTDLIIPFDPEIQFATGDIVTAAWTNTDARTYGLVFEWGLPDRGGI